MNKELELLKCYITNQSIISALFKLFPSLRELTVDELKDLLRTKEPDAFPELHDDGYGGFYSTVESANKQIKRTEANLKTVESFINYYKTGEPIKFYSLYE